MLAISGYELIVPVVSGLRRIAMPNRDPQRVMAFRTSIVGHIKFRVGVLDLNEFAIDPAGATHRSWNVHCRPESLRQIVKHMKRVLSAFVVQYQLP